MAGGEGGFTLIEILVAMLLLGIATLGLQAVVTDRLINNVGREEGRAVARQLVDDRLQLVETEPRYAELEGLFAGVDSVPQFPGYERTTVVAQRSDHTIVTVEVVTPEGRDTLAGTTVIGAP